METKVQRIAKIQTSGSHLVRVTFKVREYAASKSLQNDFNSEDNREYNVSLQYSTLASKLSVKSSSAWRIWAVQVTGTQIHVRIRPVSYFL